MLGQEAEFVWHKETSLEGADVVILPGGFSHGDYLRTGAIARFSPVMAAVADVRRGTAARCSASATGSRFCSKAGLLPGAMLRNRDLKFHCEHVQRPRGADRHAVHVARAAPARCCAFRSLTARETTTRNRT